MFVEWYLKKGWEFFVEIKGELDENVKCNMGIFFIFECYSIKCY